MHKSWWNQGNVLQDHVFFFMNRQHLMFRHTTARLQRLISAWAHHTYSLPAKMPSTISNQAPSTHAWVEKNHFRSVVLTVGLIWMQEPALKSPHTSLTLYNGEGCSVRQTTIQSNRIEKRPWICGKWVAWLFTRQRKQLSEGLETSSSSVLCSSVRPRHPATADFILEAPLGDK